MARYKLKRATLIRNIKRAIARAQNKNLPATIKEVYAFGGILRDKEKAHDFDAIFLYDQTPEQESKWRWFYFCFGQGGDEIMEAYRSCRTFISYSTSIIIEMMMISKRKALTWWKENDGTVKYTDEEEKVHNAPAVVWKANDGWMWHLCRFTRMRSAGKVYHWKPRKENPVSCPRCRYRFDSPYGEEE